MDDRNRPMGLNEPLKPHRAPRAGCAVCCAALNGGAKAAGIEVHLPTRQHAGTYCRPQSRCFCALRPAAEGAPAAARHLGTPAHAGRRRAA